MRSRLGVGESRAVTPGSSTWGDLPGKSIYLYKGTQVQVTCGVGTFIQFTKLECGAWFYRSVDNWFVILLQMSCRDIFKYLLYVYEVCGLICNRGTTIRTNFTCAVRFSNVCFPCPCCPCSNLCNKFAVLRGDGALYDVQFFFMVFHPLLISQSKNWNDNRIE